MGVDSHLKKIPVDVSVQCGALSMDVRVDRAEKWGREEWRGLELFLQWLCALVGLPEHALWL